MVWRNISDYIFLILICVWRKMHFSNCDPHPNPQKRKEQCAYVGGNDGGRVPLRNLFMNIPFSWDIVVMLS